MSTDPTTPRARPLTLVLAVVGVCLGLVAVVLSGLAAVTARDSAAQVARLQATQDQALGAVQSSQVDVADRIGTIWVRNGSRSPIRELTLVLAEAEYDEMGSVSKTTPTLQLRLGDLDGCLDREYQVLPALQRRWSVGTGDEASPLWVVLWTDLAGTRWQKVATPSDTEITSPDEDPYTGDVPSAPVTRASLDLSRVRVPAEGATPGTTHPLSGTDACR